MSKFQSYLTFDNTTIPNYRTWCWGASSSSSGYGIHQALEQLGFSQTSDQGQVVWNNITATITSVAASGGIATYGYSGLSPADPVTTNRTLRPGMLVNAISGLTNSGFDIVAPGNTAPFTQGVLILSVTPTSTTTGTFTVPTSQPTTGTTADSGTLSIPGISFPTAGFGTETLPVNNVTYNGSTTAGYTTTYAGYYISANTYTTGQVVTYSPSGSVSPCTFLAIASVPASTPPTTVSGQADWRFYNYELWQTNDGISPTFYFKIEYANQGTATPAIFFTMGTATTGQSVSSGSFGGGSLNTTSPNTTTFRTTVAPTATIPTAQGTATFECDFYGGGSGTSFSFMMWRSAPAASGNIPSYFGIERSLTNTGTYNGNYMVFVKGNGPGSSTSTPVLQANWICEPLFPSGSTPGIGTRTDFVPTISVNDANSYEPTNANSYQVGQNIAVLPCFPLVGFAGNPLTLLLGMKSVDIIEGATFTITLYGASHTYMMTRGNPASGTATYANFFGSGPNNEGNAFAFRWE